MIACSLNTSWHAAPCTRHMSRCSLLGWQVFSAWVAGDARLGVGCSENLVACHDLPFPGCDLPDEMHDPAHCIPDHELCSRRTCCDGFAAALEEQADSDTPRREADEQDGAVKYLAVVRQSCLFRFPAHD